MMKHLYLILLAFAIGSSQIAFAQIANKRDVSLTATPANPSGALDRIVAVVNEDIITLNELNQRKRQVLRQLQKQGTPVPAEDVLSRQVLEHMISNRVQIQLARESGIKADDTMLDRTLQRIAQENGMNLVDFRAAIEKDGMDFKSFREDIRNEILLTRLREKEVDNQINVSETEVESEFALEATRSTQEKEYRLQHVLVMVPDKATPQQIYTKRVRVEQAAAALARGVDFGQVAATYSEASDALSGGNLGWRTSNRLPSLFLDALSKMKLGEVSTVLKSPNGFHIFKLAEQRTRAGAPLVTQTQVRHILLRPKDGVSDAELRQRMEAIKARIASGADFAELARTQSEDGSAPRGGDLGWISPGETVPEFEQAMNDLKPGQLSNPVQSPFGWHLIQVQERRQGELSGEKRKMAIRQALRARKADEAFQDWLRQIRDRAFVENRLEEK
ncbi:MAG TPA: peptidylprolyl isomerase [Burkholderiales bacterium]|nr:peptidylprolyl isomerase [Burkholderiales bacterium]